MDRRNHLLPIIGSLLPVMTTIPIATAQTPSAAVGEAPTRILNDYIYGLAPVIMRATRDIQTAVPDQTTSGKAPINQFSYSTHLVTPQDQTLVRPNVDTLYTSAWLDLAAEPVILHVPDMGTRYYLVPMLDAYSNVFDSVGSRTTGNGAGNYAIVGPDWTGPIPQDVSRVIYAPTNTVRLLGRSCAPANASRARVLVDHRV